MHQNAVLTIFCFCILCIYNVKFLIQSYKTELWSYEKFHFAIWHLNYKCLCIAEVINFHFFCRYLLFSFPDLKDPKINICIKISS